MTVDNFDIFRAHLTFEKARKFDPNTGNLETINDTYDRYIVQVLKRAKDAGGKAMGVNTSNRLIKTYEISSLEYFDKKRAHIVGLCESNGARAYILPQVRSTYDCLKEMIRIGVDNLENPTVKFQHILRSCMCSMHKSRDKKWILDLDGDGMVEYTEVMGFPCSQVKERTYSVDEIMEIVRDELTRCGKSPDDAFVVQSRNGHTVVTRPFNLQSAYRRCGLFYEGVRKIDGRDVTGILHKDGMANLYIPDMG